MNFLRIFNTKGLIFLDYYQNFRILELACCFPSVLKLAESNFLAGVGISGKKGEPINGNVR